MIVRQKGLFGQLELKSSPDASLVCSEKARLVKVAFDSAADILFDYALPEHLQQSLAVGQRIRAPLGRANRPEIGFCVGFPSEASVERVKYLYDVVDPVPLLDERMMRLARWMAQYYCCSLGVVLSAMVPAAVKRQVGLRRRTYLQLTEKGIAYLQNTINLSLSAKGRAIMRSLKEMNLTADNHLCVDELTDKLSCRMAPFNTLARHGLIEISHRHEIARPRLPLAHEPKTSPDFELNEDQTKVLARIEHLIDQSTFHATLLNGVTGSGKTEVYMRCIAKVLQKGRQTLVLVPEIALTPQTVSRFLSRFAHVAILHSGLTGRQRHQHWRWIADGGADVVVGARSAVFAPLARLGLIVVDEEHEPGYKQNNAPRYHSRDVAIKRAQMNGIPVILGSATPSLESLSNCQSKKHYHLLPLPRRVLNLPLPKVAVVNMCTEILETKSRSLLSRLLLAELQRCLKRKKQAILLLNRRGHSNYVFCPSCQFVVTCPNCDVSLTFHKSPRDFASHRRSWVMCHHCLHSSEVPKMCPLCGKNIILIGPGTQKAEEEIRRKLPQARLQRVDSDSMKSASYDKILADFGAGRIDILTGTQMIGKGLDFPNVELVGVLNADTALSLPDFRSSERTFQLITQVAGRCGRAHDSGRVIVQTYLPGEPTIKFACLHDYESFARYELNIRKRCQMPPFQRLARIVLRDPKLEKLELTAKKLREDIDRLNEQLRLPAQVRGPVPPPIARLENFHRQEIIIKAQTPEKIQTLLASLCRELLPGLNVQAMVDVDPVNML